MMSEKNRIYAYLHANVLYSGKSMKQEKGCSKLKFN